VDADFEVALSEFRVIGERYAIAFTLTCLADRHAALGEFLRACRRYEEAVETLTALGAFEDIVGLRARQAQLYWLLGDERSSATAMTEAQRYEDRIGWPDVLAEVALSMAQLARWRGDTDEAYRRLAAMPKILGEAGIRGGFRARTQDLYGYLSQDLGTARRHRTEAFHEARDTAFPPFIAQALVGVADLALRQGEYEQAARLLAASERVRGTDDQSLPDASRIAEQARSHLGETAFAEATRAGRSQDWRELAEIALASRAQSSS
jgi:tetratricopeptide (TPR) repeat protein